MPTTINGNTGVDKVQDNTVTTNDLVDGSVTGAKLVRFTSSEQTFSAAGLVTVAHGLGSSPFNIHNTIRCVTTDAGFAVNDVVYISNGMSEASAQSAGFSVYADATNVYVRVATGGLVLANKSTGAAVNITPANWRMTIHAEA